MGPHEKPGQAPLPATGRGDRTVVAGVVAMVLAVVCGAARPAILAVLGGAALGALLGWRAGLVAVAATICGLVVLTRRRRGRCSPMTSEPLR